MDRRQRKKGKGEIAPEPNKKPPEIALKYLRFCKSPQKPSEVVAHQSRHLLKRTLRKHLAGGHPIPTESQLVQNEPS